MKKRLYMCSCYTGCVGDVGCKDWNVSTAIYVCISNLKLQVHWYNVVIIESEYGDG